ncbi:MAG: transcription elongation factor GreA [bacterium]|nr:transcription elongation factor GreA [bacterium]
MADFTSEGLEKLKQELEYLKTSKRKEIAERLKQAIAFGDLSENAAYHEAKESQGFLEGRILELTEIVREAKIIQKSASGRVALGSKVLLEIDNEKQELEIVGPNEANPIKGRISDVSPLGTELMGKKTGDSGESKTPAGKTKYKILEIN